MNQFPESRSAPYWSFAPWWTRIPCSRRSEFLVLAQSPASEEAMNRNTIRRARQQSLELDPNDTHRKLSAAAREECRRLLTQLMVQVVQLERTPEDEDE